MTPSHSQEITVEGHQIRITHPEKLLWPEHGITKALYLQKLVALAPYLLKYCMNRYLTTIRFPGGIHGESFYQKNAPKNIPSFIKTAEKDGVRYVQLDSLPALLWLGNLAALEFHPSFEYVGGEIPAEWVLDIDPSREQEPRLMEGVGMIGQVLESMGIRSVPKTSGATGVQIIIPIADGYSFGQLRTMGHFVGRYMAEKHPELFTIERFVKERGDRIYIDYVQHWAGKSLSAPYTPRGRKEATVSTPLTWEEVRGNADAKEFTLLTIKDRLAEKGDLIAKVAPQNLDSILSFIEKK